MTEESSSAESTSAFTVAPERVPIGAESLAPPTRFQLFFYAAIARIVMMCTKIWFSVRIIGLEHVPTSEPFILAPVHRSNLDFALVVGCTGTRRMRYLAKDTIWKGFWGKIWTSLGAIPVHRGAPDRDALKACISVVKGGEPLVMFPEGTRQSGPKVAEFFDGVAYVQARTGAPIVPVGIGGSEAAMPKGSKFPKRRKIVLVVGPALVAPEKGENGRVPRNAVRQRTIELSIEVQALFDEAQRFAGTPN